MNPILRAIQYFAETKECRFESDSILSFLRDEISFPRFISLVFDIDYSDCYFFSDKEVNNYSVFNFLSLSYDQSFWDSIKADIGDERTYIILLSLVLVERFYRINITSIYHKSYKITGMEIFKYDLFNIEFLLVLLNKLTDGKVPIKAESKDLDNILKTIFHTAKVPLIIDKTCFEIQNKFLFLIQIQIIFETYHGKCKALLGDSVKPHRGCDIEFDVLGDKLIILNSLKDIESGNDKNLDFDVNYSFEYEFCNLNDDYIYNNELEKMIEQSIFNTVSAFTDRLYENIMKLFDEGIVLRIVYQLLKDDLSACDFISNLISNENQYSDDKVLELIDFLKDKYPKFKISLFNFDEDLFVRSSVNLLLTAILDSFFLKKSKEELYDRCYTLLYGRFKKKDSNYQPYENVQGILYNFDTYCMLIHFIRNKYPKIEYNSSKKIKEATLQNNYKVPIVISEDFLKVCPQEFIPNPIYYQLQFIFNALDSSDLAHRIVEYFLITIRKISQIVVPPFAKLVKSIRSKNISLILQSKRYNENLEKKNSEDTIQNLNQIKPSSKHKKSKHKNISEDKIQRFIFLDGILFHENFENGTQIFQDLMTYANEYEETETTRVPVFSNIKSNFIKNSKKVLELFIYSELNGWFVNSENVDLICQISQNRGYGISLVFLFESNIEKTTNIIKIINNRTSYKINMNEDNITIFGFFDKSISDLVFGDSRIPEKDQKRVPLYMFLHVPKSKQNLPNITEIVFHIYFFLSLISDLNIIILDQEKCIEQTKVINNIYKFINYYKLNINNMQNKDEIKSLISNNKMKYLILVNDDSIYLHKANKSIENTSLFKNIACKICFINVNDQKSYGDFFNNLLKFVVESNNDFDDIQKKFSLIEYFNMNYYINWVLNDLEIILIKELRKRSKENLKHLSHILKSNLYWSNEQLENIRYGHTDFLKDEFFNIIKELCSENDISLVYEEKDRILLYRISKDTLKIDQIFKEVEKQREICQTTLEIDVEKGTNYTIRETENEREIKARIESTGKLEDLIEQDF